MLDRWTIRIGGSDATDAFSRYLTAIEYSDRDGVESDTARISLDPSAGTFLLPRVRTRATLLYRGQRIFEGVVDSTPFRLVRGQMRSLDVTLNGLLERVESIADDIKDGQKANSTFMRQVALISISTAVGVAVSIVTFFVKGGFNGVG